MRSTTTHLTTLGAALLLPSLAFAQSSSCGLAPSSGIRPSIASGYTYQVVATGLARPRGILIDSEGNLLVVERGKGAVTAHTLEEEDGCVSIATSTNVTDGFDVRFLCSPCPSTSYPDLFSSSTMASNCLQMGPLSMPPILMLCSLGPTTLPHAPSPTKTLSSPI